MTTLQDRIKELEHDLHVQLMKNKALEKQVAEYKEGFGNMRKQLQEAHEAVEVVKEYKETHEQLKVENEKLTQANDHLTNRNDHLGRVVERMQRNINDLSRRRGVESERLNEQKQHERRLSSDLMKYIQGLEEWKK